MDGLLGSGVLLESSRVSIDEEDNAGRSDEARCLSYKKGRINGAGEIKEITHSCGLIRRLLFRNMT